MPTESEIKAEFLKSIDALPTITPEMRSKVFHELNVFETKLNGDGKPIIHKFYSQWKSGKKGNQNHWEAYTPFLLGMTTLAPKGEFYFDKIRTFARPSPPDIDSDYDYEKRWMILEYLVVKYGRGRVGNIGTYQALKMKSALTRIIKALDLANAFKDGPANFTTENAKKVTEILDTIPKQHGALLKVQFGDEEKVIKSTKDAYAYIDNFKFYMDKYPEIMEHTKYIEGLLSVFSVHASGVVLSDVPLEEIAPLRVAKEKSGTVSYATQYAYEDLELLGLVKFDILALATLSVVSRAVKMVKKNYGIEIDIENLPLNDKSTLALYKTGNLAGVFQCESEPMQDTCVKIGVDCFTDIMAAISLFRPGPMDSIPEYCDRKHGRKPVSYFHPSIEPFVKDALKKTYGVLAYQEQVMQICEQLGDMTPTEALVVIKGIGKKKADVIERGHKSFVDGAVRKGVDRAIAEQYWEKFITPFALYGFNVAHSAAYAYMSFQTAYLKANFPEEFICSYLNVETKRRKMKKVAALEHEASRMGIFILARDINKCGNENMIVKKKDASASITRSEIRPSIHCKGLSHAAAENIVACRPYASIREIAEKTDTSVDPESMTALCDAGFFKTRKDKVLEEFTIIREDMKQVRKRGRESINVFDM